MRLFAVISISILLSVFLFTGASYSKTSIDYLYVGMPSSPLDDEDAGDDIEEDSGSQEGDSRDSAKSNEAPQSEGYERYEDWYESE